ncbi:MAG: GNAT family N-acetyltransferase [Paracoccaceae bacterium]|nr:MAG: GNAT family N-acetyltransferase [Paracoccaceae bacterium]
MTALADLRAAPEPLLRSVLALNAGVEDLTSPLDRDRLAQLVGWSAMAVAVTDGQGGALGFLIGMAAGSDYDSPNYRWFAERLPRFSYVDRVVVAPQAQGRGVARMLYAAYADHARAAGLGPLCCEVNTVPPNPASDAFHARLGFAEMGRMVFGPDKAVRYLIRRDG